MCVSQSTRVTVLYASLVLTIGPNAKPLKLGSSSVPKSNTRNDSYVAHLMCRKSFKCDPNVQNKNKQWNINKINRHSLIFMANYAVTTHSYTLTATYVTVLWALVLQVSFLQTVCLHSLLLWLLCCCKLKRLKECHTFMYNAIKLVSGMITQVGTCSSHWLTLLIQLLQHVKCALPSCLHFLNQFQWRSAH